ncbi:MAG: zinc ribbon domain-containing protein [Anaerolineae bacterium]|nr:MAG: zinc ribbon domain-containing protein [Anaerolineae bacterium]
MPVYTYHCDACNHEFDRQQSFSDTPLKKCPQCGKVQLHKVYKPAQVVFKGSGYYVTDSRGRSATLASNKSEKNGKSENGGGNGSGESAANGKTETKSETKSEGKSEIKPESKPASAAKNE